MLMSPSLVFSLAIGTLYSQVQAGGVVSALCNSDLDCSLNGVCTRSHVGHGICMCDKPWGGPKCGNLQYKVTPASCKNLYNISDPRNTWNGPIMGPDEEGIYHLFNPLYNVGSLSSPPLIMHGVAEHIEGPWEWNSREPMCRHCGENPAALVLHNATTNKTLYSLWTGGKIWTSTSLDGPFEPLPGATYPGENPAPITLNGSLFLTNQGTMEIFTSPGLGQPWKTFATIAHPSLPNTTQYHTEDPYMWVDKRGHWHIINHAYDNFQYNNCGSSTVSAHFFSADGTTWHMEPSVNPYWHTVHFDDGTIHTYTTLERPNLHFDANGRITHINLAADLVTGDEGCANRTQHAHFGHCPCDNCKWADHAGTLLIALDV